MSLPEHAHMHHLLPLHQLAIFHHRCIQTRIVLCLHSRKPTGYTGTSRQCCAHFEYDVLRFPNNFPCKLDKSASRKVKQCGGCLMGASLWPFLHCQSREGRRAELGFDFRMAQSSKLPCFILPIRLALESFLFLFFPFSCWHAPTWLRKEKKPKACGMQVGPVRLLSFLRKGGRGAGGGGGGRAHPSKQHQKSTCSCVSDFMLHFSTHLEAALYARHHRHPRDHQQLFNRITEALLPVVCTFLLSVPLSPLVKQVFKERQAGFPDNQP